MISNASSFLLNSMLHFSLVAVLIILYVVGARFSRVKTFRTKICSYLFWNGSIRLFMEGFLDFALFSMLNLSEIQWQEG